MRRVGSAVLSFALSVAALTAGCGGVQRVPLLSVAGIPVTSTPIGPLPLEVVTRATAIPDPLPVSGSSVAYGDIEAALGLAVSSAAMPWAEAHRDRWPEGWQLLVEVTRADAAEDAGRLRVAIDVRATLRGRPGVYLAQTSASCRQTGVTDAANGAAVVYACMTRLGRDLTSWLAVQP